MESMTATVLVIGVAALLSALLTTATLVMVADRLLRRRLEASAEQAGDLVAAKVRSAVEDAVDEALPRLRAEVSGGVRDGASEALPEVRREVEGGVSDAAEELLPKLRSEVSEGFSEALASAVTGGVLGRAGEELVRKGGNVLDVLLGSRDNDHD
jgi:hypothetical protein